MRRKGGKTGLNESEMGDRRKGTRGMRTGVLIMLFVIVVIAAIFFIDSLQ